MVLGTELEGCTSRQTETRNNLATVTDCKDPCGVCTIKILRSIQDGSEEETPECHAENQVRHFRGFTGVVLHELSTKIHDPETLCQVPIGRNPSKM